MAGFSLHLLSETPLVGVTNSGAPLGLAAARLARLANGAAAHLLVRPYWHGPMMLKDIAAVIGEVTVTAPNIRFTVLAATQDDEALYRRSGIDSIWCHQNAFLDERIYAPDLDAERLYDAVYVGRLVPFKRQELAAKVLRLAVITYDFEMEPGYASICLAAFEDLRFINYQPASGVRRLAADEVRQILTQSRCGLALSAIEGAMYASAEYLLCGLPVVTTASLGGRDVFFHPDYVETVDETPDAVAQASARAAARKPDPLTIRRRTLELFMPHRARLIMRLSGIVQQNLFPRAGDNLWLPTFVDKLEHWIEE